MWTELKASHANAVRTRGEIIFFAVSLVLIGILLATLTAVIRDQVRKAEIRDSLRVSQRAAMARCWQDSPNPAAMRGCMTEVSGQTARALDYSYGLPAREQPVSLQADVSLVTLRY